MLRWTIHILTLLSLVLCIFCGVMWVRSQTTYDSLRYGPEFETRFEVGSTSGLFVMFWAARVTDAERYGWTHVRSSDEGAGEGETEPSVWKLTTSRVDAAEVNDILAGYEADADSSVGALGFRVLHFGRRAGPAFYGATCSRFRGGCRCSSGQRFRRGG